MRCKGLYLYQAIYQDYRMSLYTAVNEQVGSLLSQGMGHVTNMVGLVRNYTTIPFSESFGPSGASWFSSKQTDGSGTLDGSGTPNGVGTTDGSDATSSSSTYTPIWPWVLSLVGWMIAISIASFAANDAIMHTVYIRLLLFIVVILSYMFNPFIYLILAGYYISIILYNIVTSKPDILPYNYAFLVPLRTSKRGESGWVSWFTSWFTYFFEGENPNMFNIVTTKVEPAYKQALQSAFPNYETWKSSGKLQKVISNADKYFEDLNKSDYYPNSGVSVIAAPPAVASAPPAVVAPSAPAPSAPSAPAPSAPAPSAPAPSASAARTPAAPSASAARTPALGSLDNTNRTPLLTGSTNRGQPSPINQRQSTYTPPDSQNGIWRNPDGSMRWEH